MREMLSDDVRCSECMWMYYDVFDGLDATAMAVQQVGVYRCSCNMALRLTAPRSGC